ncbi:hypothetical protein JCM11491_002529 [Sporobolomyces phaffii]
MSALHHLYGAHKPWPEFKPVNDSIRGGNSTSEWSVSRRTNVATFSGLLDITALGGAGFASQSTLFEPTRLSLPRSTYSGLSLSVSLPPLDKLASLDDDKPRDPPVPTKFVLIVKPTKPATRPDGRRESVVGYEFEFDVARLAATEEATATTSRIVAVEAPWHEFQATYRGRPKQDAPELDPSDIYELSVMCRSNFGKQAGPFSLDIVSLSAVRNERPSRSVAELAHRLWTRIASMLLNVRLWLTGGSRDGAVRLD